VSDAASTGADDVGPRAQEVIAAVFNLSASEVGPQTSMDTVEKWDSLQQLTLVVALEEEFEIQFTDEETVTLVNFPLIVEIVRDHLSAG
jgi:acyl carrier protein